MVWFGFGTDDGTNNHPSLDNERHGANTVSFIFQDDDEEQMAADEPEPAPSSDDDDDGDEESYMENANTRTNDPQVNTQDKYNENEGTKQVPQETSIGAASSPSKDRTTTSILLNLHPEEPAMSYTARAGTPPHRNPLLTFRRCLSELNCCQPWFHMTERVNQRELDIPESFAPYSIKAFLWKCVLCGACVGTLTYEFLDARNPEFVLAYVTNLANLTNTLYSLMSVLNTIFAARTPQPHGETTGFRIRLTWVLFELAVHLGASATLLFWYFLFDPEDHFKYLPLAAHGGILSLVLIDGFFVNRIPLRWMHYFGIILPIETLYGLWTYIQFIAKIGNPDTNLDDDSIYPGVIEWDNGWEKPLVSIVVIVLGMGPILFCIFWCISNGNLTCRDRRRYFDDPIVDDEGRPTVDDVQEGSIFSLWK